MQCGKCYPMLRAARFTENTSLNEIVMAAWSNRIAQYFENQVY
jgi:hypothetical protein